MCWPIKTQISNRDSNPCSSMCPNLLPLFHTNLKSSYPPNELVSMYTLTIIIYNNFCSSKWSQVNASSRQIELKELIPLNLFVVK